MSADDEELMGYVLDAMAAVGIDDFTKPTQEKLAEAAKPLIKYLAENYHPHITCIVDATHAEVLESQMMIRTEEFLRD